jgi:hypothetical protein
MKSQRMLYFILIISFVLNQAKSGYSQNKTDYPVSIETLEGVKTIMNPRFPRDKRIKMEMIEELSIGTSDGEEHTMFNTPKYLKINDAGDIFIYDPREARLLAFNKQGIYEYTIGGRGQGPGEYLFAFFDLAPDGSVVIIDPLNRRLTFYDTEGGYLKSSNFEDGFSDLWIDGNKRIYTMKFIHGQEDTRITSDYKEITSKVNLLQLNDNAEIIRVFGEFKESKTFIQLEGGSKQILVGAYDPKGTLFFKRDGTLYYGFNEEYLISVYNPDAKLIFKFGRDYIRKKNPRYKGESNNPKYIPAFANRFLIEETNNNIWVQLFSDNAENTFCYDVFTEEGIYIMHVTVPHEIYAMKDGKAYSIVENDDGYLVIKRFALQEE